jgi:hypothetical protein
MAPRCVLIERPTEYHELLARHGTREQASFFLSRRGRNIEEPAALDEAQRRHRQHAHARRGAWPGPVRAPDDGRRGTG